MLLDNGPFSNCHQCALVELSQIVFVALGLGTSRSEIVTQGDFLNIEMIGNRYRRGHIMGLHLWWMTILREMRMLNNLHHQFRRRDLRVDFGVGSQSRLQSCWMTRMVVVRRCWPFCRLRYDYYREGHMIKMLVHDQPMMASWRVERRVRQRIPPEAMHRERCRDMS